MRQLFDIAPVQICLGANAHVKKNDADALSWGSREGGCGGLRIVKPATDVQQEVWIVVCFPRVTPSQGGNRVGCPAGGGWPEGLAGNKPMRCCWFHKVGRGVVRGGHHGADSGTHESVAEVAQPDFGPDQGDHRIVHFEVACA